MAKPTYALRSNLRLLSTIGAGALMGAAVLLIPVIGLVPSLLLMAIAVVLVVALSIYWFVGLDELGQRGHYVAWFWGGSLGIVAGPIAFFALLGGNPSLLRRAAETLIGGAEFQHGIVLGMAAMVASLTLGYAVWWAVFWLRNR